MSKQMRKVRVGSVVRVRMDQTAVVEMVWKQRHRLYRKQMRRVARFYVHDPQNQCLVGDTIRIQETRPISKTKHWRLMEILQRRQLADIRPIDLETDIAAEIADGVATEETEAEVTGLAASIEDAEDEEDEEDAEEAALPEEGESSADSPDAAEEAEK